MTDVQANYLVSIVMCGNFRDAAETLFVTPSTISQAIAALEAEYGAQIVIRSRGGVILTPLGEKLYRIARDIVKRFQDAEALKSTFFEKSRQHETRISVFGDGLRKCLHPILLDCMQSQPDMRFSVFDAKIDRILQMLRDEEIGFAMISAPSFVYRNDFSVFSSQIITRTDMMLQVSRQHPLCRAREDKFCPLSGSFTYTLEDLDQYRFVFSSEEKVALMEAQVPTFGWKERTMLVSSDYGLLTELIQSGSAVGVSFDEHLFPREENIVYVPMHMNGHLQNMITFVVANDIKKLDEVDKYIISEVRRCILRQGV